MKKLVPESISEALEVKSSESLNESMVGDWFNTTKGLIQGVFKKAGKFFMAMYKDKILPVITPVNIAILKKLGKLPKAVIIVPNSNDLELLPELSSLNGKQAVLARVAAQYKEDSMKLKRRKKLQRLWESVNAKKYKFLNEAEIEMKYSGQDKVPNVSSTFLKKRFLLQVRKPNLTAPLIWGAPGIGKTAITNAVVEALGEGYRLIDIQTSKMAPDDWTLPAIITVTDTGTKEAVDIPKNWLPVYEPTEDEEENAKRNDAANWGNGGIIFLDELSRASAEVQNTCLKLVHQRIIGDKVLGSKWAIVAATNREQDDPDGGQTRIGSALANRFQHFNFVPSVDEWIEWGRSKGKIDERILTFVDFNRDHFYLFDNEAMVNTTPRSWEALSEMMSASKEYGDIVFTRSDMEAIMMGTISPKTVEAFAAFLALLEAFRPEEILMVFKNPAEAPKPKKVGSGYDVVQANALIGAICSQSRDKKLTAKEVENFVTYWVSLENQSISSKALFLLSEVHEYIGDEIGLAGQEKDTYKKAMDIFRAAYGKLPKDREDVMA